MRVTLIVVLVLTLVPALVGVQKAKTIRQIPGPKIESFEPSSKLLMTCGPANGEVFCNKNRRTTVTLEVKAQDTADEKLTYTYSVNDGVIIGEGSRVTWDLQAPTEKFTGPQLLFAIPEVRKRALPPQSMSWHVVNVFIPTRHVRLPP